MKSPARDSRKAQKMQLISNNPAITITSPYLSGPIRPCRALSRDGHRGRTRSNPPPNSRGNGRQSRSKSPALADRRRYDDSNSVSSVGSNKGYGRSTSITNRRNNSARAKGNENIDDKTNRTILLPTEVDETLREMKRFPIQVHLPFEFYKIYIKENKNANLPIDDSDDSDDDSSSIESKYAEDLNDLHVFPLGNNGGPSSPSKKQKYNHLDKIEREFVKFPPVVQQDIDGDGIKYNNNIDNIIANIDMKNKLTQRKKKIKKNRKLLKRELNDMVTDTIPRMKTRSTTKKVAAANASDSNKKMMNSLLQPLSGSLSAKNSRTKTWI